MGNGRATEPENVSQMHDLFPGNRHEDGTQSDSEDPVAPKAEKEPTTGSERAVEQTKLQRQMRRDPHEMLHNKQAFVIEFFEDTPRKKRSQSFTHSAHSSQSDTDPGLKTKVEKRKNALPAEKQGNAVPPSHAGTQAGKPNNSSSGTQRASSFKREKTEDRISSSSSSTSRASGKTYGSVGRKSKMAQDFMAEYLRETAQSGKAGAEKPAPQPMPAAPRVVISSEPESASTPPPEVKSAQGRRNDEEDSVSETGTYTIETESQDKEVEEARKMIDQVNAACFNGLGQRAGGWKLCSAADDEGSNSNFISCCHLKSGAEGGCGWCGKSSWLSCVKDRCQQTVRLVLRTIARK